MEVYRVFKMEVVILKYRIQGLDLMKIYENWDPSSQLEYIWWCEQKFLIFLHLLHYNGTNKLDSFVLNLIIHDLKSTFSKHHSQLIHLPLGSPWYKRVARDLNNQNLRAKNSIIKFKKGKMQKKTRRNWQFSI